MKWADCAVKPSGVLAEDEDEDDDDDDDEDDYSDFDDDEDDEDFDEVTSTFDIQNIDLSKVGNDLQHRCERKSGRELIPLLPYTPLC